jgi:GDPmannose 4,6-dehydratase
MLQADNSVNYLVVKGEIYTVRNFLTLAAAKLDLDTLVGDASKAWQVLGLKASMSFDVLVGMMVDSELELAPQERTLLDAGDWV